MSARLKAQSKRLPHGS